MKIAGQGWRCARGTEAMEWVLIGAAVLALLYLVTIYNGLVALRARVAQAFGDVDVQLKQRHDLIPNLVETVKGYAQQEKDVLVGVTEARAKATSVKVDASTLTDPAKFKEYQDAQNNLSGALGRLIATSEAYPDLKSNQNFLALQSQLEGTENRVAVARRDYISTVRAFNTEVRTIPGRWIAAVLYPDAKPMEEFASTAGADRPPPVKF